MYKHNQLIFPSHLQANTRFFVIAGFALNGPVGTPFQLAKDVDAEAVLGQSRMADNYMKAIEYGIQPLIFRMNGSHGECEVVHEGLNIPALRFTSLEATDDCNDMDIHLFPTHLAIEGLNNTFVYYFDDYVNLEGMVTAIKQELYFGSGEVDVEIIRSVPLAGFCTTEIYIPFTGADDGYHYMSMHDESDTEEKTTQQIELLKEMLIEEDESGVYFAGELSSFNIDTLLFTDVAYERAPVELRNIFGAFAKSKTEEQNIFCSTVLCSDFFFEPRWSEEGDAIEKDDELLVENGESEEADEQEVPDTQIDTYLEQVQTLLTIPPITIEEKNLVQHIEVVVGAQNSNYNPDQKIPCAAEYASMRYKSPYYSTSPTNKGLESLEILYSDELLKDEVAKLSSSGYICIVPSIKKGFVPFTSRSLYPENTFYAKPHYLRAVYSDAKRLANAFNFYIGEPLTFTTLNSIVNQLNSNSSDLVSQTPIYQSISVEVLEHSAEEIQLTITFHLFGEVESVKTSYTYEPYKEVTVEWI